MGLMIIVVLGILFFLAISIALGSKSEDTSKEVTEATTSLMDGNDATKQAAIFGVAGINKNGCRQKHVGVFEGYIEAEHNNPFDSNAIMVVHSDGTKLGYIKQTETDAVRAILPTELKRWPIIGKIKFVNEGMEDEESKPDGFFVARIYIDSEPLNDYE